MKLEKLIAGLLLLPFILALVLIFFPLILLYGVLMLLFRRPMVYTFGKSTVFSNADRRPQDDDIIDVEVIRSENSGETKDAAKRISGE